MKLAIKGAMRRLHYGPGPHPSGSEQDVHAGDRLSVGTGDRGFIIGRLRKGEPNFDLVDQYWGKEGEYYITRDQLRQFMLDMGAPEETLTGRLGRLTNPGGSGLARYLFPFDEEYKGRTVYDPYEAYFLFNWMWGEKVDLNALNSQLASIEGFEWAITEAESFQKEYGSNDFETGVLYDQDGNVVLKNVGEKKYVAWETNDAVRAQGGVMMHNHPSASGFSRDDVLFVFNAGTTEFYAVGGGGQIFRFALNPKMSIKTRQILAQEFLEETLGNKPSIDGAYFDGRLNNSDSWTELFGNGLMALERRYPNLIDYEARGYDHIDFKDFIEGWRDTSK